MTTTKFVDIILSDVRFIDTLGLSAEIVEKKKLVNSKMSDIMSPYCILYNKIYHICITNSNFNVSYLKTDFF
jgi:hypothetical protein